MSYEMTTYFLSNWWLCSKNYLVRSFCDASATSATRMELVRSHVESEFSGGSNEGGHLRLSPAIFGKTYSFCWFHVKQQVSAVVWGCQSCDLRFYWDGKHQISAHEMSRRDNTTLNFAVVNDDLSDRCRLLRKNVGRERVKCKNQNVKMPQWQLNNIFKWSFRSVEGFLFYRYPKMTSRW